MSTSVFHPARFPRTIALLACLAIVGCGGSPVDEGGREIAEWVLSKGGEVVIAGSDRTLSKASQLKEGPIAITSIDLAGQPIRDSDLERFEGLGHLEHLTLYQTRVTDDGLDTVAKLKTLKTLELSYTGITDAGLEKLVPLANLERLHTTGTAVTADGRTSLERARSGLTIIP